MASMMDTVVNDTTFVMSRNNNTRIDTLIVASPHAATGITSDFDVTWDYPENNHLLLHSAHWMRCILLSRNKRWNGFIYVIWLFKLVAGSRNYYQLHNQFRGDKLKSIALMAWACAKLED